MFKDLAIRIFLIHLATYVVVTAVCVGVNLWLTPDHLWVVWVALGWGIAVATHGLALVLRKTHRRERIFIDRKARGFTVHLFAYVATVLLLFVVNLTVTPNVWWFYFVALGWGAGVAAHGWCVFLRKRKAGGDGARPRRRLRRVGREPLIEFPEEPKIVAAPSAAAHPKKSTPPKKRTTPRKKPPSRGS